MAKANDKKKRVEGVDVTKADATVVGRFVVKFKIKPPANATLEQEVRALAKYLKTKTPAAQIADCDVCGGDSDVRLECCPYCGIGDEEAAKAAKAPAKAAEKAPAKAAEKPTPPTRQQAAAKAKGAPSLALVPPPKDGPAKGKTEADLDKGVKRVAALKAAGAVCIWELGGEVARLYDERLYMLRKTKSGHGRYKNWNQFVQVELGMSTSYSYKLMDVSKLFRKEDLQVGVSKLSLMIQVPEKERKQLLEKARDGMSASDVAKEVKEMTAGKGPRATGRDGFKGGAAGAAKGVTTAAAKRANEVTVATQLGRVTIPLYQRASSKKDAEPKRAKTLAQDPHGKEELISGMVVHYRLVKQAKGLALVVERRREEPGK